MKLNSWPLVQLCPLLVKINFPGMDQTRYYSDIVCYKSLTVNRVQGKGGYNNPTASQVVGSASIQWQRKGESPRTKRGGKKQAPGLFKTDTDIL